MKKKALLVLAFGAGLLALVGAFLLLRPELPWASQSPGDKATTTQPVAVPSGVTPLPDTGSKPIDFPLLSWNPNPAVITLSPGDSQTVQLKVTPKKSIRSATLKIDSALAPLIPLGMDVYRGWPAGVEQTLTLKVQVSPDSAYKTVTGTLTVYSGTAAVSPPLPITVNVWPDMAAPDGEFSFNFPPSFSSSGTASSSDAAIVFYDDPVMYAKNMPPRFAVSIDVLPAGQSLREWVRSFGVSDDRVFELTLGGRSFLKWSDSNDDPSSGDSRVVISYSTLLTDGQIVTFASPYQTFAASPEFEVIVSSIQEFVPR